MKIHRVIIGSLLTTAVMCVGLVLGVSAQNDERTKEQIIDYLNSSMSRMVYDFDYDYYFDDSRMVRKFSTNPVYGTIELEYSKIVLVEYFEPDQWSKTGKIRINGEGQKFYSFRSSTSESDIKKIAESLRRLALLSKNPSPSPAAKAASEPSKDSLTPKTGKTDTVNSGAIIVSDEAQEKADAVRREQAAAAAKQKAKDLADAIRARERARTGSAKAKAEADRRWKAALIACFGSANAAARAKSTKATVTCQ